MTGLTVERNRIVVDIAGLEDWEIEALREEIEKILELHRRHRRFREGRV